MKILLFSLLQIICQFILSQDFNVVKSYELFDRFDSNGNYGSNIENFNNNYLLLSFNYDKSSYKNFSLLEIDKKGNLLKKSKPRYCDIIKYVSNSNTLIVEKNRILVSNGRFNKFDSIFYLWIDIFDLDLNLIDSVGYNFGSKQTGATKFKKIGNNYVLSYIEKIRDSTTSKYNYSPKILVLDSLLKIKKAVTISGNPKLYQYIDNDITVDKFGNIYMFHGVDFANFVNSDTGSYFDQYLPWNTFVYITKLDKNYTELWTKNLKYPVWNTNNNIFVSKDDNMIILSSNRDTLNFSNGKCCALHMPNLSFFDTSGVLIEEKINYQTYVISQSTNGIYEFQTLHTIQSKNGDFIQGGLVYGVKENNKMYDGFMIWLSRIDNKGKTKWFKCIHNPLLNLLNSNLNFSLDAVLYNLVESDNGDIAGTGIVEDTFPDQKPFINDIKILFLTLDSNGCFNGNCDTIMNLYQILSNNEETRLHISTKIFPNPSYGDFTLNIDAGIPLTNAELLVYDLQGKIYLRRNFNITEHWQERLHIDAPPGMYFIHIIHEGKHYVEKHMIAK